MHYNNVNHEIILFIAYNNKYIDYTAKRLN